MKLLIRPATRADVAVLLDIERESFSDPHWKAEDFAVDCCRVAEIDAQMAGFLVSKQVFGGDAESPPEREILNLAVRPCFRGLGVASALLTEALAEKATYFLEVRASNVAAQTLYRRFGFVEVARRHDYYRCPVETAIVMRVK